jgi:hypothetical protein
MPVRDVRLGPDKCGRERGRFFIQKLVSENVCVGRDRVSDLCTLYKGKEIGIRMTAGGATLAAAIAGSAVVTAAPATRIPPRTVRRVVASGKVRAFARTVALGIG